MERMSEFITLDFHTVDGLNLPVATTRPELLAACVAVFVHPSDSRYKDFVGQSVKVPFYDHDVPVLADFSADPEKGTGVVMCCTFGDPLDVTWWRSHGLPCLEVVGPDGRMLSASGLLAGLGISDARERMKTLLESAQLIRSREATLQSVRVHERCDTPVEYRMVPQWFVRLLDHKGKFMELGDQLDWYPQHMKARFLSWVDNLSWDWSISRQRSYGVPFPVWYCTTCRQVMLPAENELPIDPMTQQPGLPCSHCGGTEFEPERDVFDTWMTSSCTPQIVGRWRSQPELYAQVFPYDLRPHAHEIIRTWTFYSVVKSFYHFGRLPWKDVAISGWGIAGEGMGKISKSRGGGPITPSVMIERYSADAMRYWAASTGPGKDAVISEEKIQNGSRLVNKLWNVARFAEPFICAITGERGAEKLEFSPADRWILARMQSVISRTTSAMVEYDYAAAKNEVEGFFWRDLADNYLEMAKQRLYDPQDPLNYGAAHALRVVLLAVLKLFAPFLPYVTDEIYRELYAEQEGKVSIHSSSWPEVERSFVDPGAESFGEILITIATAVRRYKSQRNLPLGKEIKRLQLAAADQSLLDRFQISSSDLKSITRAREIICVSDFNRLTNPVEDLDQIKISIHVQ
jgi:valyl-tRNA synthetase